MKIYMKLLTKTPKLAWLILLLLPFAACLALPLALLSGDLKQAGKCGYKK